MLKAVILIGGPQKGTRFRPLSLEVDKPLFPIAGFPMIQLHMEACVKVPGMKEILLIGFYQKSDALNRFVLSMQSELSMKVRYLQEYTPLGTAGGLYHFRDQIMSGSPDAVFVLNADVCCDLPLPELLAFHQSHAAGKGCTVLGTRANRKQALNYGCIVENERSGEVMHYVEKPESFVSDIINCGAYVVSSDIFQHIGQVFARNYERSSDNEGLGIDTQATRDVIRLEQDVLVPLAGSGKLFVYKTERFWTQVKSAGSAIYASRLFMEKFARDNPERLTAGGDGQPCEIIGNVRIHPSAAVDRTACVGPNAYIGPGVVISAGARVRDSIVLDRAELGAHCCVLHSIVGWSGVVGAWARVEGTPNDPNPNDPFARLQVQSVFGADGRLNPSITILGKGVRVPAEVVVRNCIVLPHKELASSYSNEIIL